MEPADLYLLIACMYISRITGVAASAAFGMVFLVISFYYQALA